MAVSTTTVAGDIPAILEPFYLGTASKPGLLERATQAIYPGGKTGFAAYEQMMQPVAQAGLAGAGQIAPMSQFQQQVGQRITQQQLPGAFGSAYQAGAGAQAGLQGLLGTQAESVAAPQLTQFQLGAPQQFGLEQAQQYMSPYIQSVIDAQQRNAIQAAQQAQLGQNLASACLAPP